MATQGEGEGAAPDDAAAVLGILDHSVLRPDATEEEVLAACRLGAAAGVATVCVQPCWLKTAVGALQGTSVKPASVLGFPHGATTTHTKRAEAISLLASGARELDMVINVGWLKSGRPQELEDEISVVHAACLVVGSVLFKVILETCYLTEEEKREGALLAARQGVEFVKTSTGFGPAGATVEDVRLLREVLPRKTGVKAAGGIRTLAQVREMIAAGASRIGTSATAAIAAELGVEV